MMHFLPVMKPCFKNDGGPLAMVRERRRCLVANFPDRNRPVVTPLPGIIDKALRDIRTELETIDTSGLRVEIFTASDSRGQSGSLHVEVSDDGRMLAEGSLTIGADLCVDMLDLTINEHGACGYTSIMQAKLDDQSPALGGDFLAHLIARHAR